MNKELRTKNQEPATRSGFTLIELLAAVAVLMIIGLILANVFHQSTIAWESGLRRVEMSAEGRAALDLMAHEISQAVGDPTLPCTFNPNMPKLIQFYTSDDSTGGGRALRRVTYEISGSGSLLRRGEEPLDPAAGYPAFSGSSVDTVVENVAYSSSSFSYPSGYVFSGTPPAWVDVELQLSVDSEASLGVTAWSIGRDDTDGTDDDIEN